MNLCGLSYLYTMLCEVFDTLLNIFKLHLIKHFYSGTLETFVDYFICGTFVYIVCAIFVYCIVCNMYITVYISIFIYIISVAVTNVKTEEHTFVTNQSMPPLWILTPLELLLMQNHENIIIRLRNIIHIPLPIRNVCYKNCGYIVLFVMQNSNCTEIPNIYILLWKCMCWVICDYNSV